MESGPTCSNFSPKTQTWQRSCPTVQLDAPICAQQAVPKKGAPARQGLGRSRGGFSGKIHLLVDALGFPLQFILTGGERHDLSQAESLLAPFHFDAAIADKDYSSDLLGELVTARQVEVFIPSSRLSQATARDNDRLRYRKRNIAERFINRVPSGFDAFSPAMKSYLDASWLSCTFRLHLCGFDEMSTPSSRGVAGGVAPHKGRPERPDRPTAVASGQGPGAAGDGYDSAELLGGADYLLTHRARCVSIAAIFAPFPAQQTIGCTTPYTGGASC